MSWLLADLYSNYCNKIKKLSPLKVTPINKFMYDEPFLSYEYNKEMNQFSNKYCYPEDLVFHEEYNTSLDLLSKWSQQHNSVAYDTIGQLTISP